MTENVQPAASSGAGANGDQPGIAHYEKQRQYLKELLQNRKLIERQLVGFLLNLRAARSLYIRDMH